MSAAAKMSLGANNVPLVVSLRDHSGSGAAWHGDDAWLTTVWLTTARLTAASRVSSVTTMFTTGSGAWAAGGVDAAARKMW